MRAMAGECRFTGTMVLQQLRFGLSPVGPIRAYSFQPKQKKKKRGRPSERRVSADFRSNSIYVRTLLHYAIAFRSEQSKYSQ